MGGWESDAPDTPVQRLASENAARTMQRALQLVRDAIAGPPLAITGTMICQLHAIAMQGLVDTPGVLRSDDVRITGSRHAPPAASEVAGMVDELCAYCNTSDQDAIHRAAYVLWRLNWIHPFAPDSNGRTARAVALVVLHAGLGILPSAAPGKPSWLEYLNWKRLDYNDALEAADTACADGRMDVSMLEDLMVRAVEASTDTGTKSPS